MNIEEYKKSVQKYSNSELISQHEATSETLDLCWDNAEDTCGEEREQWYSEYNECKEQLKVLENEMSYRGL